MNQILGGRRGDAAPPTQNWILFNPRSLALLEITKSNEAKILGHAALEQVMQPLGVLLRTAPLKKAR